jgi:hypothetical protein
MVHFIDTMFLVKSFVLCCLLLVRLGPLVRRGLKVWVHWIELDAWGAYAALCHAVALGTAGRHVGLNESFPYVIAFNAAEVEEHEFTHRS